MASDRNGNFVSRREMLDKIQILRWEQRAYALGIVITVLFRGDVKETLSAMTGVISSLF